MVFIYLGWFVKGTFPSSKNKCKLFEDLYCIFKELEVCILILPYSSKIKHPFFAHNAGQAHYNVGQNHHNSGKGCLFSEGA